MAGTGVRIGLFGGTFDPVHLAHLRTAEEVREALGLDRVELVLSARPPHKAPGSQASIEHRRRMLELAIAGWTRTDMLIRYTRARV